MRLSELHDITLPVLTISSPVKDLPKRFGIISPN
jgi:hypothetical protein